MRELKHALTGGLYGVDPENGLVKVQEGDQVGWFDFQGVWQAGDAFHPDPQMCNWVGGPAADGGYDRSFKSI